MEIHPVSVVDELEGTYEKSSWPHVAARKFKSILRKHISEDSKFYPGSEDDKLLRKIFKKRYSYDEFKKILDKAKERDVQVKKDVQTVREKASKY